jgi:molybdate transport system substrate-binding protein
MSSARSIRLAALAGLVALCLAVSAGGASAAPARAASGITVFAAASLTQAFPVIAPGNTYSFAGSNTLAAQITNGAPADVFASANTTIPATLYAQGVIEKPVNFTRNTLVMVVPKSNPANIHSIYDLTKPGVSIDIAGPAVPVGSYTLQVWTQMGLTSQLQPNVVSQEVDVTTVLAKIVAGQADVGFVYSTDADTVPGQVTVINLPAWAQPKVVYAMAVVTKSPNQPAAQAFVSQVLSPAGQAVMRRFGFLPLTAPVPTISRLSASSAKVGATLTVTGTNFTGTTSVTFEGIPARFKVLTGSKLAVTVPARAKTGSLTVTNPSGTADSKLIAIAA